LGIDDKVGSLEKGKDADFVIWSGDPLSMYSVCEQTWIDGTKYFDLDRDSEVRQKVKEERNQLIQKILTSEEEDSQYDSFKRSRRRGPNEVEAYSCVERNLQ